MSARAVVRTCAPIAAACVACVLAWAAFAPVPARAGREQPFVIPEGTWARRMAGERVEILPQKIRLTLGINDILLLDNRDKVPQIFGPTLLMPGQRFRLPFERAAEYQFACTAHASGQMVIVVDAFPDSPWARLRWRALGVVDTLSGGRA